MPEVSTSLGHKPLKKLGALLCLLAVLLLQAPFVRAAWISAATDCCTDGQCTNPRHHHKHKPAQDEMPMQCDHEKRAPSDCKMSCCNTAETAITITPFVVPHTQIVLDALAVSSHISGSVPQLISRFDKPQSPPPRSFISI